MNLNHFNEKGKAIMVNVADKQITKRTACARGFIKVNEDVYRAIKEGTTSKGDVFGVAVTAGIMAAKRTWQMIPMCHMIPLESCSIDFDCDEEKKRITCTCTVGTSSKTGVEMEALTGTSVALLTVYDMCKSMDKFMEISDIHLVRKEGGKSGDILNIRYEAGEKDV